MVWWFIGVYIINRILHGRLEIRNFSSRVEKYFTRSLRSLVKYFSTLEEKFRTSARPCNILYFLRPHSPLQPLAIFPAHISLCRPPQSEHLEQATIKVIDWTMTYENWILTVVWHDVWQCNYPTLSAYEWWYRLRSSHIWLSYIHNFKVRFVQHFEYMAVISLPANNVCTRHKFRVTRPWLTNPTFVQSDENGG